MNVSMQDAFNLAWKIAMVERGEAQPTLLNTYQSERTPVAQPIARGHAMRCTRSSWATGKALTDRIAENQRGWLA